MKNKKHVLIKLRNPPEPPQRKEVREEIQINYYDTDLESVINDQKIKQYNPRLSDVKFEIHSDYYGPTGVSAWFMRKETDEEFQIRKDKYDESLEEYNKWREDNKDAIETELLRRKAIEDIKTSKKLERLEKRKKSLDKEIKTIKKLTEK